ncbi:hypothetical protein [Aridibaculum aurantiacum]|uniref:hypothetical protein n=1 Tax=Aridibaculum aurantiacum TaxID=2810307 RepID=UPI001A964062|nr:hypothetical protein [Aridibaculum aurantiacum]
MTRTEKLLVLGGATLLLAAVSQLVRMKNKSNKNQMLQQVSDEGYETAADILFPGKKLNHSDQQYGPVWKN